MSAKCFCPVNLKHSLVKALSLSYNCYFFLQRVQADRGQWEKCVKRKYTHFFKILSSGFARLPTGAQY